jgi:hypothetical protein
METAARFIVAMFASALPRRWWHPMEAHVPVRQAAVMSGIATFLFAMAVGLPAYVRHAEAAAGHAVDLALESSGWRPAPEAGRVSAGDAQATWVASFMSPVTFVFSPIGALMVYLAFTGGFRAISAAMDDARGDPVLTAVDGVAFRWKTRRARRRAIDARAQLEGSEVPDRVTTGAAAGIPGAEVVIVASRRKPGWDAGVFVITDEGWFRLGPPADRDTPLGLRTLYPLTEVRDQEALRKSVHYQFPRAPGRVE